MSPGSTQSQKVALVEEMTSAYVRTCNGIRDRVMVLIEEMPIESWGVGGKIFEILPDEKGVGGKVFEILPSETKLPS